VRLGVDELGALALQRVERGPNVVHLERHVVHAGPARGEEPADGRVVLERREQLNAPGADEDGRRLDPLLGDSRTVLELRAEQPRVRPESVVEIVDRDTEVMNRARIHANDASRR
jgi:hypothetical protein